MIDNVSDGGPYRNDRQCLEARVRKLEARNRLLRRALKLRLLQILRRRLEMTAGVCMFVIVSSAIAGMAGVLVFFCIVFGQPTTAARTDSTVRITPPLVVTGFHELDSVDLDLDVDTEGLTSAYDQYPYLWNWDSPICARPFQIFDPELWIWIQCERRMCLGPLRNR